jgi:hypothetical protein
MIKILDNFLTEREYGVVRQVNSARGYILESDSNELPPTGMTLEILPENLIYQLLADKLYSNFDVVKNLQIYRLYVNCFAPLEWPYYHTDVDIESSGVTCLYYLNESWDINDGGETQFFMDNEIISVAPIPNRVICFDSTLLHKATSFRNKHRFTIAIKYN